MLDEARAAQAATGVSIGIVVAASRTRHPLDARTLARLAARHAGRVLRLDPALPFGHARDLDLLPNTLPPARHLGYAVQWFAMALAVLVIAAVLQWRTRRRGGR